MLSLELLPAAHGDSIWIEYGTKADPHRIVIDGGPAHTYKNGLRKRIEVLPVKRRVIDLMVVTHIDADHIDGPVILLQKSERAALKHSIREFWFNAWHQLPAADRGTFAPEQGEFLSALIETDEQMRKTWNQRFAQAAVMVDEDEKKPLPELEYAGAKLTLLGPGLPELRRLRTRWDKAIREFEPGDAKAALKRLAQRRAYRPPSTPGSFGARSYGADRTVANGSSITIVLEYEGVSLLLAGDAHASRLATSLRRFAAQRNVKKKLRFDAVKLPHHGSMGNVDAGWLEQVDCKRWLFSTNGAVFDHPDVETGDLIAKHAEKPVFLCNYEVASTKRLAEAGRGGLWTTAFPEKGADAGPVGGLELAWPESGP